MFWWHKYCRSVHPCIHPDHYTVSRISMPQIRGLGLHARPYTSEMAQMKSPNIKMSGNSMTSDLFSKSFLFVNNIIFVKDYLLSINILKPPRHSSNIVVQHVAWNRASYNALISAEDYCIVFVSCNAC